jgi:hypothetical protein
LHRRAEQVVAVICERVAEHRRCIGASLPWGGSGSLCVEQELSSKDMRSTSPQVGTIDLTKLHDRPRGAGAQIAG